MVQLNMKVYKSEVIGNRAHVMDLWNFCLQVPWKAQYGLLPSPLEGDRLLSKQRGLLIELIVGGVGFPPVGEDSEPIASEVAEVMVAAVASGEMILAAEGSIRAGDEDPQVVVVRATNEAEGDQPVNKVEQPELLSLLEKLISPTAF